MIRIKIGNEERTDDIDEQWIAQQIINRRKAGESVCVLVSIECTGVHLTFATPECDSSGGRAKSYTPKEREVIEEWNSLGLGLPEASPGKVIAFLKKIRKNY